MRREAICYVLWTVIITAITKGVFVFTNLDRPTFFWSTTLFVAGVSILIFLILVIFGRKKPERFVKLVLGSMVVKLIVFMMFVAGLIYMDRENANVNIVLFLALYICYTTIEVVLVFKKISANN